MKFHLTSLCYNQIVTWIMRIVLSQHEDTCTALKSHIAHAPVRIYSIWSYVLEWKKKKTFNPNDVELGVKLVSRLGIKQSRNQENRYREMINILLLLLLFPDVRPVSLMCNKQIFWEHVSNFLADNTLQMVLVFQQIFKKKKKCMSIIYNIYLYKSMYKIYMYMQINSTSRRVIYVESRK